MGFGEDRGAVAAGDLRAVRFPCGSRSAVVDLFHRERDEQRLRRGHRLVGVGDQRRLAAFGGALKIEIGEVIVKGALPGISTRALPVPLPSSAPAQRLRASPAWSLRASPSCRSARPWCSACRVCRIRSQRLQRRRLVAVQRLDPEDAAEARGTVPCRGRRAAGFGGRRDLQVADLRWSTATPTRGAGEERPRRRDREHRCAPRLRSGSLAVFDDDPVQFGAFGEAGFDFRLQLAVGAAGVGVAQPLALEGPCLPIVSRLPAGSRRRRRSSGSSLRCGTRNARRAPSGFPPARCRWSARAR